MRTHAPISFCLCLALGALSPNRTWAQSGDSIRFRSLPGSLFWENTPLHFHRDAGGLTIEASEKTDMFHHHFVSKWDGGAIVLNPRQYRFL